MTRRVPVRITLALTTNSDPDMSAYIDTMIFIGLYFAGVLLVLFIGGVLVRTNLYRAYAQRRGKHYPSSRILQDLRPIQQTMVDFIAVSAPSRELLQRLTENEEPTPVRKLLENASAAGTSWTALLVMRVAGLVRFGWQGVRLTDVGREVLRRFQLRTQPEASPANEESSSALLTPADYRELTAAVVAAKKLAAWQGQTGVLQEKLAHAVIARRGNLPPGVITMNTRAELVDLETNEPLKLTLVFPIDANFEQGRISVFDSLGVAMLGRRAGDRFNWSVPYGVRHFEVKAIHFQPETALSLAA
jgi:regulator of nucleoside diphosphate kinase